MKTAQNIPLVLAQCVRAAVRQLYIATVPLPEAEGGRGSREMRRDALDSLDAVAEQLVQYAGAFGAGEPSESQSESQTEMVGAARLQGDAR